MGARRTEKISAVLTPELAGRLSDYALRHRWSLSTAVAELIEQGVRADEIDELMKQDPRTDSDEHSARYHQHALYRLRASIPAVRMSTTTTEDDR